MTDIFEEVEEQLRSEKYVTLFKRGWPWALGVALGALAITLAVWGWQTYRAREAAKASEDYAAALDSLQKGDVNGAYAKFQDVVAAGSRGYETLALMQQGGIDLQQGKTEAAVALFDKAAKVAPSPALGDVARLKSAFALMDTAPLAATEERLTPLTDAKRPYAPMAREALAMAKLKAGQLKAAREDFAVIGLLPDVPDSVRQRAQIAIAAIDNGSAPVLPQAVKVELTLPPAPPPSPVAPAAQSGAAQ